MEKTLAVSVVIGASLGKRYFSTFDNAQQKAVKLGKAFSDTNKKLQSVNGVTKYRNLLATLKEKQAAAGRGSKRLAAGIEAVERKYKQAKKEAKEYGIAIGDVVRQQKHLTQESAKLDAKLQRLNKQQQAGQRLSSLKTKALGAVGLVYSMSRLVGGSFDLEAKKHQLGDVITGNNREERLAASLQHAKDFSRKSLASEADILEIDYSLRSSGLDDEAAQFGSEVVSKVATVTNGYASDVGFIIGDVFTNMWESLEGSTEEKITRIGDVLTKTKNLYSIKDFNQLGEGLKEGLSGALANNLSLEQTAALIGQINNGMLKGSQAGTGLNAMLRQLPNASEDMGFSIVRDSDGVLDTIATLESLQDAISYIDDPDEKSVLLQKAFGDEGKKALIPLLTNLNDLKKNFEEVRDNAKGTFDEGYQRRLNSTSGQWKMFKQNLSSVGTTFANTLLPALNTVLTPLAKIAGWAGEMIEKFPVIGWVIGGVATSFVVAATAIGIITAAQWLWNTALLANPIGMVVAGISLVVGGAYALYKNWNSVTTWFNDTLDSIGEKFSWVGDLWNNVFGKGEEEKKIKMSTTEDTLAPNINATQEYADRRYNDIMFSRAPSGKVKTQNNTQMHTNINIHPSSAMNEKEIARQIDKRLQERERSAHAQQRGALYDYAGAY